MSYLLFMDESGHDHKSCPYEVRGGAALHAGKLWGFVRAMANLEENCFGVRLNSFGKEAKGSHLLDKDRFRWAEQDRLLDDAERRKHCIAFLNKGAERKSPARIEFTAYGQASLKMAGEVLRLLVDHEARLFASIIPRDTPKPSSDHQERLLRKDLVFLLERYFYFLEERQDHGLLVMDETEKQHDRKLIRQMERYYTLTATGLERTAWIVPSPVFVSSDMAYAVQAADICIYCINWGFRLPAVGIDAPCRSEVETLFAPWVRQLQYHGEGHNRKSGVFRTHGIVYVPDLYERRT